MAYLHPQIHHQQIPGAVLVKKCNRWRPVVEEVVFDDIDGKFYEIDQSECDDECSSRYRCAGEYSCGYLLGEKYIAGILTAPS